MGDFEQASPAWLASIRLLVRPPPPPHTRTHLAAIPRPPLVARFWPAGLLACLLSRRRRPGLRFSSSNLSFLGLHTNISIRKGTSDSQHATSFAASAARPQLIRIAKACSVGRAGAVVRGAAGAAPRPRAQVGARRAG